MVMFRQVISSSSSAASSTIAAPMRLITADSSSARNPERMPPPAPEMPPSHSSPNISHDHSSSLPPEKTCASAPMVAASRNAHVTRSATGRPSCSSKIRKPSRKENGNM